MKLGLDFHGVINKIPNSLTTIAELLLANGHEVHVITGEEDTPKLRETLKSIGVPYTHLFSISSYHKSIGTKMWKDGRGSWMDPEMWNVTKAWYCTKNGIDLHIDDSEEYGKFFKTPYLLLIKEKKNA